KTGSRFLERAEKYEVQTFLSIRTAGCKDDWCELRNDAQEMRRAIAFVRRPPCYGIRMRRARLGMMPAAIGGRASLTAPDWFALFQECADALLRVHCHRVLAHYFFRVIVCLRSIEIDLIVERPLADPDYERAGLDDLNRQRERLRDQLRVRHHPVHESPLGRGVRSDRLSRQQHFHRMLSSDRARQRHHRRRAEKSN